MPVLDFVSGTLELRGVAPELAQRVPGMRYDPRDDCHRARGLEYAGIVRALRREGVEFDDRARRYSELAAGQAVHREPRVYQSEALAAWNAAAGRGVVVLPTGAGKSHVASMAIEAKRRSALVVVPTLDLVRQWYDLLRVGFGCDVGVVGGGEHQVLPLTVTTYDSAYLHMEHLGARFGLVVFDECHHLPGPSYRLAAESCIAPYRLGLSATPERGDGLDADLDDLIGPIVFEKHIHELSGRYLAEYDTQRIEIELSDAAREEYAEARATYTAFLRAQGIRMSSPRGFSDFIMRSSRSEQGQRAMAAYRRQREIAFAAPEKLDVLETLIVEHRGERMLVFTQDNRTAYLVSRRFLVPVITHQTKVRERSDILQRFSSGEWPIVATSKVLNEGVDVPEASVAVVISGSGSVREHVQRLGRILRPRDDKRAVLYEIVTRGTGETFTSERRREHAAYREA
ncbi:MAG: DEAD/DEAH box helicase family protein [Polyangiaceae bacterium]|nr:DEAD/DEAH box helicase family protein [Polyangiaceae bacterium]